MHQIQQITNRRKNEDSEINNDQIRMIYYRNFFHACYCAIKKYINLN